MKIKVLHYPQVPCQPFEVIVDTEKEAALLERVLADQHLFLFANKMIPDYSNAVCVMIQDEDGEWSDYFNEELMCDWDEFKEQYLS